MRIGVPKEIKNQEYRVGMTPATVQALVQFGHQVFIQKNAGEGSGIPDDDYLIMGAQILPEAGDIFEQSDMIVKVKEPLASEVGLFKPGQILFTYLHLAADKVLTQNLLSQDIIGIAYETIQKQDGSLPLLHPMSMVAGRLSVQEGANYLKKKHGGYGVLLGGVPGVEKARVTIIGGGVVGTHAARMALGLGAEVTIVDIDAARLEYLDDIFQCRAVTLMSNHVNIATSVEQANLVIGAVLIPGAKAPRLVTEEMVRAMKPGSVIVDVAVDQGGCVEGTRPTTHDDPVFIRHGVIYYCVANMPGGVARTSTFALNNATLPYVLKIADAGVTQKLIKDTSIARGVNLYRGKICHRAVAECHHFDFMQIEKLLR